MTNNELLSYVDFTKEVKDLQKQYEVVSLKLGSLKSKARQMMGSDDEAIFCIGGDYYRVYLDGDDDIQVTPIRYIS